jgi:hypothetical protein
MRSETRSIPTQHPNSLTLKVSRTPGLAALATKPEIPSA